MRLKPKTAEVFSPLWVKPARYKGSWGGRGSGKSNDRAQAVIVEMITKPGTRIVCLREVQNSIKDSVYQLITDWIGRLGVGALFDITRDEIRGPNGSLCIFRGMKDQNAESIKSLEGYRIAWFEEAQTCSQRSLDLLRPTLRTPGSELWFTWNPRKRTDPVDVFLRSSRPADAVVVKANYSDNPWFPKELEGERLLDKAGDAERYAHVWEGAYEATSSAQFMPGDLVAAARKREVLPDVTDECVLGVDVARFGDDRSAIVVRRGRDARTIPAEIYANMDTMQFAARVARAIQVYRPQAVFIDEGGVGGGVVDRLRQLNFRVVAVNFGAKADYTRTREKAGNKRAEMWMNMREWMAGGSIPDDDGWDADLTGPEYRYDVNNAILLEKKEDMKKRGLRSPDVADALALTFAYPVAAVEEDDFSNYERRDGGRSLAGY